jgi:hypothetical protein
VRVAKDLGQLMDDRVNAIAELADEVGMGVVVEMADELGRGRGVMEEFLERGSVDGQLHGGDHVTPMSFNDPQTSPKNIFGDKCVHLLTVSDRDPRMTRAEMPPADDKDKRISLRVSPEMYAQIERLAEHDHRTIAGWVKALIAKALEANTGAAGTSSRKR